MSWIFPREKILPPHQYPTVCIMCNSLMLIRELLAFLMCCCWRESLGPAWAQSHTHLQLWEGVFGLKCVSNALTSASASQEMGFACVRLLQVLNLDQTWPQNVHRIWPWPLDNRVHCASPLIRSRPVTLAIDALLLATSNCHKVVEGRAVNTSQSSSDA